MTTGYYSDECIGMWELRIGSDEYWFTTSYLHPLQALLHGMKMIEELTSEIDSIDDPDEEWSIRHVPADEPFSIDLYDSGAIGPFKPNDESRWEGTVKEAVDLLGGDDAFIIGSVWDT